VFVAAAALNFFPLSPCKFPNSSLSHLAISYLLVVHLLGVVFASPINFTLRELDYVIPSYELEDVL
jgi:hypothetical protein